MRNAASYVKEAAGISMKIPAAGYVTAACGIFARRSAPNTQMAMSRQSSALSCR